jgi:hypothetical protein
MTIKTETLADRVVRLSEEMAFPPTEWEASTLTEVLVLPRVVVTRPAKQYLLSIGMIPYGCHINCAEYVARDPEHLTRHVWGWIIHGSDFILHSVVERDGQWRCLTPQLIEVQPQFIFIPDPAIEWVEASDGSGREPIRNGTRLPEALRKYPEDHIRMRDRFRELIRSGTSVMEARSIIDATLGAEFSTKPGI